MDNLINSSGIKRILGIDPSELPKYVIIYHIGKRKPPLFKILMKSKTFGNFFDGRIGRIDEIDIAVIGNARLAGYHENLLVSLFNTQVEYVISIGLGGAIPSNIGIGEIVIPSASVRGEGLTNYYLQKQIPAVGNIEVLSRIYLSCIRKGLIPKTGIFYTTESKFKEKEILSELKKSKIIAIEMELALIYGLAHMFQKKAGGLYIISDQVGVDNFPSEGFNYSQIEEQVNLASEIIVDSINRLEKVP